jgi:predicted MFS family arabinose efflux permease
MDRNAPISIAAAIAVSIVGVFALMTQPMIIGIYAEALQFTEQQGTFIVIAEIAGGALASILAMFWIRKLNWRAAIIFALSVVIIGNLVTTTLTDANLIIAVRFLVGFFGQGTAFAVGISMIGATSDPDRNFGFVIAGQVAFGVVALLSLPALAGKFQSIGGMYVPLAAISALALTLVKFIPAGMEFDSQAHGDQAQSSLALPVTALIAMLVWCCGLGAMWTFVAQIGIKGGVDALQAYGALSISSAIAITGSLAAATIAAKGVNRFLPVTIALLAQMVMAWLLQGEMNFAEMVIKASIFQIFWNMTGPFYMGAIAASDTGGKVSVLIPAAQTSGFFIGPAVVGMFLESYGLVAVNYITIGFCAVSLVIFIPLAARLKAAGH